MTLKIGADSQMHQLPAMLAQRIAMRLKGGAAGTPAADTGQVQRDRVMPRLRQRAAQAVTSSGGPGGGGFGQRSGGAPDFQQMLSRMPASQGQRSAKGKRADDCRNGGNGRLSVEVIILLSGVEPILTAASPRDASTILSPWNLSPAAEMLERATLPEGIHVATISFSTKGSINVMRLCAIVVLLLFQSFMVFAVAQTSSGVLHGRVTDPSGQWLPGPW